MITSRHLVLPRDPVVWFLNCLEVRHPPDGTLWSPALLLQCSTVTCTVVCSCSTVTCTVVCSCSTVTCTVVYSCRWERTVLVRQLYLRYWEGS